MYFDCPFGLFTTGPSEYLAPMYCAHNLESSLIVNRLQDDGAFSSFSGEQLGLLDEHNLKFATSQVLRKEPRRGVEAVYSQAADSRSSGTPYASSEFFIRFFHVLYYYYYARGSVLESYCCSTGSIVAIFT